MLANPEARASLVGIAVLASLGGGAGADVDVLADDAGSGRDVGDTPALGIVADGPGGVF